MTTDQLDAINASVAGLGELVSLVDAVRLSPALDSEAQDVLGSLVRLTEALRGDLDKIGVDMRPEEV